MIHFLLFLSSYFYLSSALSGKRLPTTIDERGNIEVPQSQVALGSDGHVELVIDETGVVASETKSSGELGHEILNWDDEITESLKAAIHSKSSEKAELGQGKSQSYQFVQFVGLSFYTFPQNFGSAMGGGGAKAFYKGIDDMVASSSNAHVNNVKDAEGRVEVLKNLLESAADSDYVDTDSSVLKVFVAPEFFFRGPHGAYNMKHLGGCTTNDGTNTGLCTSGIVKILEMLSSEVRKAQWSDWIFVMGTIVSVIPGQGFEKSKYYNFAPILQGGPDGVSNHHIVGKNYVSGIDFLDCHKTSEGDACVANPIGVGTTQYAIFSNAQRADLERLGFDLSDDFEFQIHGIKFMVEVCLDHSVRKNEGKQDVDVHIVTSAGMSIQYSAARNGPVFLQDGGMGGAKSEYNCPNCATKTDGNAYSTNVVYMSPNGHCPKESVATYNNREVSTDRATDKCYSKRGFATEGSGHGIDPRFKMALIEGLFSVDSFTPQINIGPAFQLPGTSSASGTTSGSTSGTRAGGCSDIATNCYAWKSHCHSSYAQQNCKATCGVCGTSSASGTTSGSTSGTTAGGCFDSASNCYLYTSQCGSAHIQRQCKKTCGVCGTSSASGTTSGSTSGTRAGGCSDIATNCYAWKSHCHSSYAQQNCKATCGICGTSSASGTPRASGGVMHGGGWSASGCRDIATNCYAWKRHCTWQYAQENCKQTCGLCR